MTGFQSKRAMANDRFQFYQVWDGDLFLYTVETEFEADEAEEAGFTVVKEPHIAE